MPTDWERRWACRSGVPTKPGRSRPCLTPANRGGPRASRLASRTSTSATAQPRSSRSSGPADGKVRLGGVTTCTNAVLHPWLKRELAVVLASTPKPQAKAATTEVSRKTWERWQDGLTIKPTLLPELPPLRMLLVLDNLAGHKTPAFVCWLFEHGIMPLYTPVGGSWLNMAESIQRILKRRALNGQHPTDVGQIVAWFEAVAAHWNAAPTPFIWGGKRAARRRRQWERRHRLGGSGACTREPIRRRP